MGKRVDNNWRHGRVDYIIVPFLVYAVNGRSIGTGTFIGLDTLSESRGTLKRDISPNSLCHLTSITM